MSWQPPGRSRERVLVYGDMGSWKSSGIMTIASHIDGKVYAIDTDDFYERILDRRFPQVNNIEVMLANTEWPETAKTIERAFQLAGPDDWVALDSTSDMWDQCIDYHTELLTGDDLPAFLIGFRERVGQEKAKKQGVQGAMVEDGLYDYVNPAWRKVVVNRTKASKCHVYMTAQAGQTGNPNEDALTKSLYGHFGVKPRTQKAIGFNAATVLLLTADKMNKHYFSEVKAAGFDSKELVRDCQYEELAMGWLFKRAGWRPGR